MSVNDQVEDRWPEVELSRRAVGYPLYLKANSLPADEFERYVPATSPNVLTPDEARLLARMTINSPALTDEEHNASVDLRLRLSTLAEGEGTK